MANLHLHDTLDPAEAEVRYLPQPRRRRPGVLGQWAWGLWDMVLRLVEFSVKMFAAAVIVAVLIGAAVAWGWHHVVEAGVDKLQCAAHTGPCPDETPTTTTP